ncbi:MAG: dihydroorotate dehydrogenase electron transfer subunit [Lachnospiraceae bacterium]|nr:dihydroorotate dehydrogenase electron transfer subunit [Lachnospiraceae bacterium]
MFYGQMEIVSSESIRKNIQLMVLAPLESKMEGAVKEAGPGQFAMLHSPDDSRLLPRPISIYDITKEGFLAFIFALKGEGTRRLSELMPGSRLYVTAPLGNGFPLEEAKEKKRITVIGGGLGVPPMYFLSKALINSGSCSAEVPKKNLDIVLGYRSESELILEKEFEGLKSPDSLPDKEENGTQFFLHFASDDGSFGSKGNVLDLIRYKGIESDIIFACGPKPMLRGIQAVAQEKGIPAYLSLEERMACGVGACLGCVVKTRSVNEHSLVKNVRVCKDGPVFLSSEVEL